MDLLHEFELGVFKSVFRHLLRLLYAINLVLGTNLVAILDAWYVLCMVYHTQLDSLCVCGPDSTRFHPLERVQFDGFRPMSLKPVSVQPGILKMSFR